MTKPICDLEEEILADLQREVEFTARSSRFYSLIFENLRCLMFSPAHESFSRGVIDHFQLHPATAWFEHPLLMAAALHRGVLAGDYPDLALFYATASGAFNEGDDHVLREAIASTLLGNVGPFLRYLGAQRLQTNEVSRGICWLLPLLAIWREHRTKVVLVELGCSAGLNLTADTYNWAINGTALYGDGAEQLIQATLSDRTGQKLSADFVGLRALSKSIAHRIGYDIHVPDLADESQVQMLRAMVWGDDTRRMMRLEHAIKAHLAVRERQEISLENGDAVSCLGSIVGRVSSLLEPGDIVCIYNTVVTCYFDDSQYTALHAAVEEAFSGRLARQHCVWIEHEPLRKCEADAGFTLPAAQSYVRCHQLEGPTLRTRYVGAVEMHPANYWDLTTVLSGDRK